MRIALVVAPMLIRRCPLIGLGYIAAYLKARGHEVTVIDLNTHLELPYAEQEEVWGDGDFVPSFAANNSRLFDQWTEDILRGSPDVVAFSVWATTGACALILSRQVRRRAKRPLIVWGGPEAGFKAEAFIRLGCVDAVISGEGEESLAAFLEEYSRSGKPKAVPGSLTRDGEDIQDGGVREEIRDLDALPFPDYSGFPLDRYFMKATLPLSFNRGCIRRCVFCNIYDSWKSYRHRSAASIFQEIMCQQRRHPEIRHFEIDVAALNLDLKVLSALSDRLIDAGVPATWAGAALFRPDCDLRLLKKMARAGLKRMDIGFESGSPKVLRLMKKGYLIEHAARMLRDSSEAGIEVILNVVVGFPGETEQDFQLTKDFLLANAPYVSAVGPPSELWIGNNYMQRRPDDFDVVLDPKWGHKWVSKDGLNTNDLRRSRAEDFLRWANDQGLAVTSQVKARQLHQAHDPS